MTAGWLYDQAVGRCAAELQLAFGKAMLVKCEFQIACKATQGKM